MEKKEELRERSAESPGLVSVVLNFFNAESFLIEAIDSVYAQSYPNWELLLVDDGSTDKSTGIAKSRAVHDPTRVRYLEHEGHENRGASAARNLGIGSAQGEFIAFLDADDVWLPERLERSLELLRGSADAQMVYGETQYWYSWSGPNASHADRIQPQGFQADRLVRAPELLVRYLSYRAALPCMGSITLRRKAALACEGFVESFRGMHDDQAFLARFCLHNDVFVSHECWDRYRQHEASLCAQAVRDQRVNEARQRYLSWLRSFMEEQGLPTKSVWTALRHAEQVERLKQRGPIGRLAAGLLNVLMGIRLVK